MWCPLHADASTDLNRYLLEIACVPESILQAFHDAGWEYHVSPDYLRSYSEEHGMNCIGLTSYSEKRIYVSTPSSTIHEFGHFLEWVLRFPPEYEMRLPGRGGGSLAVLRSMPPPTVMNILRTTLPSGFGILLMRREWSG